MRLAVLALAGLVTVLAIACGGDGQLPGNVEDVPQEEYRFLAEGEFIDFEPIGGGSGAWISIPGGLPGVVSRAEAIVVVEVLGVIDIIERTRPAPPNWPVAELEDDPLTIYSTRVEQWIKGNGAEEVLITQFGGVTASGPRFTDGDFLLEPGRRYVVALMDKDKLEGVPGPGKYVKRGLGFGAFEVTDGSVHVLNNPLTQELQEQYGGMSLQEFVQLLKDFVANPWSPPPRPTPAPHPQDSGPVAGSSLVIDTVAIDTDIRPGRVTSLGTLETCITLRAGATVSIEIAVDAVPLVGEAGGGITAFQFKLLYDPNVVSVAGSESDMLLAANAGSTLIPLGDGTPDTDGSFVLAVADFGRSSPESGAGVLARITLEGVGPGLSPLTLTDVGITDDTHSLYTISHVLNAQMAVDEACPGTP